MCCTSAASVLKLWDWQGLLTALRRAAFLAPPTSRRPDLPPPPVAPSRSRLLVAVEEAKLPLAELLLGMEPPPPTPPTGVSVRWDTGSSHSASWKKKPCNNRHRASAKKQLTIFNSGSFFRGSTLTEAKGAEVDDGEEE